MTEYTFTFEYDQEKRFKQVLNRLADDEINILKGITQIDPNNRWSDRETIIEMDPDSCLTIRMAMGNNVKIRRKRSEEEIKAEEERDARHKVSIKVIVPKDDA